jgi:methylmalonyl-CoA mutase cobalamin-binding subunit
VLPTAGAEVILLGSNARVDSIVRTALEEDADAIVLGVYNGNALELGRQLAAGTRREQWGGMIYMGGILNQDTGEDLPIDARPELEALGVCCVDDVEDLLRLLALG